MFKRDKGQGVKKYTLEGKLNPEWVKIHRGTKPPKGSIDCGQDHPKHLSDLY